MLVKLRQVGFWLSMLLLVLSLTIWIRSRYVYEFLGCNPARLNHDLINHGESCIAWSGGEIVVHHFEDQHPYNSHIDDSLIQPARAGLNFSWTTSAPIDLTAVFHQRSLFNRLGFAIEFDSDHTDQRSYSWDFCAATPCWFTVCLFSIPLLRCVWRSGRRLHRTRYARCLQCGYDLRASKDRCPECGTPIPAQSNASSATTS